MVRLLHRLGFGCWIVLAALIIAAAVLLSTVRLFLPMAGGLRDELEAWVSDYLGQPVHIADFEAVWQGFGPVLEFRDVTLLSAQDQRPVAHFQRAQLGINLFSSLTQWQLQPSGLVVVGARLSVQHKEDGSLGVVGLQAAERPGGGEGEALTRWLFEQNRIGLMGSEIYWQSPDTGHAPFHFTNVNLTLRNDQSGHRLTGDARLSAPLGERLRFVVVFDDKPSKNDWSGRAFLQGEGLGLAQWLQGRLPEGLALDGITDVQVWGEWRQARVQRLEGKMIAQGVVLTGDAAGGGSSEPFMADALDGRFIWQRRENGWRFDVSGLSMTRAGLERPAADLGMELTRDEAGNMSVLRAGTSRVRLDDAADLWRVLPALSTRQRDALAALKPRGELQALRLSYRPAPDQTARWRLAANFNELGFDAWEKFPGLSGLSGRVEGDERQGHVELDGKGVRLEAPRLLRDVLEIDRLAGRMGWQGIDGGVRISSDELVIENPDIRTRTRLALDIPRDGSVPFLDMQTVFHDGNVAQTSRYLPAGILPPRTLTWLDHALIGGRITAGHLIFHGRLNEFPFQHGQGRFEARFNVDDGILDYKEGWPRLEEVAAEVTFHDRSVEVHGVGGKIFNVDLPRVDVGIENLKHAVLTIDGEAVGPGVDMLRYVRESPLAKHYGGYLQGLETAGRNRLDLNVNLPLYNAPSRTQGVIHFLGGSVSLPEWGLRFSSVRGALRFDGNGIHGKGLQGRGLGGRLSLDVSTETPSGADRPMTVFGIKGHSDFDALSRELKLGLDGYTEGETDWTGTVHLLDDPHSRQVSSVALHAESDLVGLRVTLPEPVAKKADEARHLVFDSTVMKGRLGPIALSYGDRLDAVLALDQGADGPFLERGELRFGGGEARLPAESGIHLSGQVARLDVKQWRDALARKQGEAGSDPAHGLSKFDLGVGELVAFGRVFHGLRLQADRIGPEWVAYANCHEVEGVIHMPQDLDSGLPLTVELKRLRLSPQNGADGMDGIAPQDLPPLQVTVDEFIYKDTSLGHLQVNTVPHGQGLRVNSLSLESPELAVTAQGDWVAAAKGQTSRFEAKLSASDLGKALTSLGYAGTLEGGETYAELSAAWSGSPTAFALERAEGSLYLKVEKGRLLEVEPGAAGRVFGLLSVQALPRRLSLDFSDFFQKGFSFDRIEGHFAIGDGEAVTKDLAMDSPTARILVSGRTGLVAHDYDQEVTVMVNVASTLPVAAGLAGGPGLGLAVWVTERLFREQFQGLVRYQYSVKGPWADPVISRQEAAEG